MGDDRHDAPDAAPPDWLAVAVDGTSRPDEAMLRLVYAELRRLATAYMRRERPDHTLQPTALVHEAYLRLVDQRAVASANRAQFVGLAAVMMRRILVNHARDRIAAKRGGIAERVPLTMALEVASLPEVGVLDLHDALERLAALDSRQAHIVELKFFGGLTTRDIGDLLMLSHATIERDWAFARAWLHDTLSGRPR